MPTSKEFSVGSLFEKYGGVVVVHDIVSAFYDSVLDDDMLADYFINSDMETLVKHQTNFISSVMGGPGGVSDARLRDAHAGLGIDRASFDLVADILAQTLADNGVEAADVKTLIEAVAAKIDLIIA